ncbi:PREDICTED: uncharacterized protein LOC105567267 [Vollenhovia emeryi]|uniref:uncharacterized protein LOC105567267 n=1 Tax=Vollenhovia emeryi TaxID=411798 RepID=UPI0005F4A3F0|nr:PREDICTED: uncharacterized protein LOC105567267 [Vollenhovia emeryi]XP_011877378.1 PREDICTED: uncharacterized protein LOC105567267 [Vollenhovia emeryi]
MLKFTIILAILSFTNAATAPTEDSKDQLLLMILEAKNRAFNQIQTLKLLAATDVEKFITRVNEMVETARSDMETLKNELGNINDTSCEKSKNNINDYALKTIAHFQSCVEKVTDSADADMNSLAFEGSLLTKEIQYTETINKELLHKVTDFEAKSFQFAKYMQKLEKCETQSNLPRFKRQISETLTSYKRCLQDK